MRAHFYIRFAHWYMQALFRALLLSLLIAPAFASAANGKFDGEWSLSVSCDGDIRTVFPKGLAFTERVRVKNDKFAFTRNDLAAEGIAFSGDFEGNDVRLVARGPQTRSFPQAEFASWRLSGAATSAGKFLLEGRISNLADGYGRHPLACRGELAAAPAGEALSAAVASPVVQVTSRERETSSPSSSASRAYDGVWSLTISCYGQGMQSLPRAVSFDADVRIIDGKFSVTRGDHGERTRLFGELQGDKVLVYGDGPESPTGAAGGRSASEWKLTGTPQSARHIALRGTLSAPNTANAGDCRGQMILKSQEAASRANDSPDRSQVAVRENKTSSPGSTTNRVYDGEWSLMLSCDDSLAGGPGVSLRETVRVVDGKFSFTRREPRWITTFAGELQGTTAQLTGQTATTEFVGTGVHGPPSSWRLQGALENPRRFSFEGQRHLVRGQPEKCRAEMVVLAAASTNTATLVAPTTAAGSPESASAAAGSGAGAARADPLTSLSLSGGRSLPLPKGSWRLVAKRPAAEYAGSPGAARTWNTTWYELRQAQSSWDAYVLKNEEPGSTIPLMIAYAGTSSGSWTLPSCRVPASYVARNDYGANFGQRRAQCSGIARLDRVALAKEFSESFSHSLDLGGMQEAATLIASTATVAAGFVLITDFYVRLPEGVAADRLVQSLSADSRTGAFRALREWLAQATRSVDLSLYENQHQPLRSLAFDVDHRLLAAAGSTPSTSPATAPTTPPSPAVAAALPAPEQAGAEQRPRPPETQAATAQTVVAAASTRQEKPPAADGLRPGGGPATEVPATSAAAARIPAPRKALIIGNNSYRNVARLQTAKADAQAIERALAGVGYTVTAHYDLTEREMKRAIRNFVRRLAGGDEVVFFYAGHGVQIGGANYLLPVDIGAEDASAVRDEAIPLQRILDDLAEARARFTLAIVDACRDNPFAGTGTARMLAARGLAPTSAASGQMIMFSAGTGQQALDRVGPSDTSPNGLFTRVLLRYMMQKDVPVDRILRQVRAEVVEIAKSIGHEQVPALYDQAIGEFYFAR